MIYEIFFHSLCAIFLLYFFCSRCCYFYRYTAQLAILSLFISFDRVRNKCLQITNTDEAIDRSQLVEVKFAFVYFFPITLYTLLPTWSHEVSTFEISTLSMALHPKHCNKTKSSFNKMTMVFFYFILIDWNIKM